jgi:hypothetical protein
MVAGLIGKVARQAIKKLSKKKPNKKTRKARQTAKKRKEREYDLASEQQAFNSPQYGRLSKKDFKQKPPTKKSKDDLPF